MTTWTAIVEEGENGEAILTFPPELLEQVGWTEGTTISWKQEGDNWILSKVCEYEQEDLDKARDIISKGYLIDDNKQTLTATEENIIECAKSYYKIRMHRN